MRTTTYSYICTYVHVSSDVCWVPSSWPTRANYPSMLPPPLPVFYILGVHDWLLSLHSAPSQCQTVWSWTEIYLVLLHLQPQQQLCNFCYCFTVEGAIWLEIIIRLYQYNGISLQRTPLGPCWLSCIERWP